MPDRAGLIELTQKLQEQTDVPAWVVAPSSTVLAVAAGKEESYGPRGKWFCRVFNLLGVSIAARIVLQFIGSMVVTIWWLKCRKVPPGAPLAEALFIGFGAGPEKQMLEQFRAEVSCEVAHIDQTKPASLASVVLPSIMRLWKQCAIEARKVIQGLRFSRNPLIHDNARQWLISSAIRFSDYVFVKTWAEALPLRINRLVFISADIPAFAALDAINSDKRRIEYRQHGLHKISIVFPPFMHVIAINRHDALHIIKRLPNANVTTVMEHDIRMERILNHTATMLIVSTYDSGQFTKQDHVQVIRSIYTWAMEQKLRVVIRLHPSEGGNFWLSHFPEIPIDNSASSFSEALAQLKPLFVVGWWSTCHVDALKAGVLPVLIMSGSEAALKDMVFPLRQLTFQWEQDKGLLTEMITNRQKYSDSLTICHSL